MSRSDASPPGPMASRVFQFEADFAADLRCLPMAVRRKLDLAGVKLKLAQWHGLTPEERERLLAWSDDGPSLDALHLWLLERSRTLPQGPAQPLPPVTGAGWQQAAAPPPNLVASCAQLGLVLQPGGWGQLDELQRFALVKLSHPGHEHRNLPKALREFNLVSAPEGGDVW
jgi:hypothetical protein